MRNPGKILQSYKRCVTTNQRIYFDIDSTFNWLCTGNNDGRLSIWPLEKDLKDPEPQGTDTSLEDDPGVRLNVHNDCVNGVR